MSGQLLLLRIEIDGHFNGSRLVPKPWVAQITGTDPKYGLARKFIDPMNDWTNARRAWSGNLYGRVAQFALRDGNLYEVSRLIGKPSRRYIAREFLLVTGGAIKEIARTDIDAIIAHADEVTMTSATKGKKFAIVKRDHQFSGIVVSNYDTEQECSDAFDSLLGPDLEASHDDPHICISNAENYPVGSRAPA